MSNDKEVNVVSEEETTRLRFLRIGQSLTVAALARLSGYSQPALAEWESGKVIPTKVQAAKLAKILNEPSPSTLADRGMMIREWSPKEHIKLRKSRDELKVEKIRKELNRLEKQLEMVS